MIFLAASRTNATPSTPIWRDGAPVNIGPCDRTHYRTADGKHEFFVENAAGSPRTPDSVDVPLSIGDFDYSAAADGANVREFNQAAGNPAMASSVEEFEDAHGPIWRFRP